MRALHLTTLGASPELVEIDPPEPGDGEVLVELDAVSLNPVDVAVASGSFFAGHPAVPYVPGCEGVGRVVEGGAYEPGTRVWIEGSGIGIASNGTLAERVSVPEQTLTEVPEGVSDELACALGIAGIAGWIPVSWRLPVRPDDRVLVLGATSTVGLVAIQSVRALGAARIVGAGRRASRLALAAELGADATVELGEQEGQAKAFIEAFDGEGPTYVFDALWGAPIAAALESAARGVRVIHVGQAAGPIASIPSNFVRGRQAEIIGYSNLAVPRDVIRAQYAELLAHAAAGRVRLDLETFPFEDAPVAWARQAAGPGAKLVVTF